MLSKEEYLNLVDILADEDKFDEYVWNFVRPGDNLSPYDVEKARDYIVINLKKLIEVHFDNPPLKFEELKEKMWIWDNKHKEYGYIYIITNKRINIKYIDCYRSHGEFEENRFFRYEVK